MQIEAYDFGIITVGEKTFTKDLKIIREEIIPNWWRIEGHRLLVEDIRDILEARPDVLVVGTGHDGLMSISEEVRAALSELGIELIALPTRQACDIFNRTAADRDTAFAAHLTC
jgi:hypothetical protein